jgi:hypothetical protein
MYLVFISIYLGSKDTHSKWIYRFRPSKSQDKGVKFGRYLPEIGISGKITARIGKGVSKARS